MLHIANRPTVCINRGSHDFGKVLVHFAGKGNAVRSVFPMDLVTMVTRCRDCGVRPD